MSLQEDINTQVATIHEKLDGAAAAVDEIVSTHIDLSEEIASIPDQQEVDFSSIISALYAVCDALDVSGGDTIAAREAIASISNGAIDFAPAKSALTASATLMSDVSENLDRSVKATTDHLAAGNGMVSLLIDQSNFDGSDQ